MSASTSGELAASAAAAAKAEGNAKFKAKDFGGAIRSYSEAIALEPETDLHVLYSNRSAAYLALGDAKSKAFKDAERCVALAPTWAKGYSRLGAAEHALGRFAKAQESYKRALALCAEEDAPSAAARSTYEAGLEAAKEGERRATAERIAEEQRRAELEAALAKKRAAEEALKREAERATTEDSDKPAAGPVSEPPPTAAVTKDDDDAADLDAFFAAVGDEEKERERAKKRAANPITEKYRTQALGKARDHVERLTEKHAEFKNLNPYLVLQLDVDATPDDIKMRYRKLSALCHPDKNVGDDQDRAREAFEAIKTAYQALTDPKTRDRTILVIDAARDKARQEHARLKAKGVDAPDVDPEKEVMKTFARNEMKRRDVEEHKRAQAARERAQEDEAKKKEADEHKFEEQWNQDARRATRIDFWSQFQDDRRYGAQKRLRTAKNFKQETKVEHKPKYGQADIESWKKEWK